MKMLIKEFEWKCRALRQCLSPRYHREYRKSKELFPLYTSSQKPIAFIDVSHIKLDRDGGRYAYILIKDVLASGHHVVLADRFGFFCSFHKRKLKQLLVNEEISRVPAKKAPADVALVVSDRARAIATALRSSPRAQSLMLDYTYRNAKEPELCFPFFPHPDLLSRGWFSSTGCSPTSRPVKVAFIGAYHSPDYDKPSLSKRFGVMTRHQTVSHLRRFYPSDRVTIATDSLFTTPLAPADMVLNEQHQRIRVENYRTLLGQSCFFLACAGVSFPASHNLPEAMLSGCIPILEYAEHLTPALMDGINCLTYDDTATLEQAIIKAIQMPEDERLAMQENVYAYAELHCQIGSFTRQALSDPSLHQKILLYSITQP